MLIDEDQIWKLVKSKMEGRKDISIRAYVIEAYKMAWADSTI